jgi:spore coat polysaccharide biosynthesis protein SpsF
MDICGKPLLRRVIDRVRASIPNLLIVVATPDKEIALFAKRNGVERFLGSENDVLARYYQCAVEFDIDPVIRITADNPLIQPSTIRTVFDYYQTHKYDWVANCRLETTFPVGDDVEVFSFKALERAWCKTIDKYDSEHVTPYIYKHPEIFKLHVIKNDTDLSHLRWTVDTPEDLKHVREIYKSKYEQGVSYV